MRAFAETYALRFAGTAYNQRCASSRSDAKPRSEGYLNRKRLGEAFFTRAIYTLFEAEQLFDGKTYLTSMGPGTLDTDLERFFPSYDNSFIKNATDHK